MPLSRCCFTLGKLDEWCPSCVKITQTPAFKVKSQNCKRFSPLLDPGEVTDNPLPYRYLLVGCLAEKEEQAT